MISYGAYVLVYFSHICMSTNLHMWYLLSIFVAGTYMAIEYEINVAIHCILSNNYTNMWSVFVDYIAVGHICTIW